ncbi:MAG: hypothetical protein JEZ14_01440 [Marinilabiliaceae bacterium]|nr:hypothetical protein [Marinilabiliaceae bacterium]
MSNYYQTTLEQVAEWFMQLFFDPMYHVESVIRKNNDVLTKTQASIQEVKATPNLDNTAILGKELMVFLSRFSAKFNYFKKPEVRFITKLNQLSLENLLNICRLRIFNMTLQQI